MTILKILFLFIKPLSDLLLKTSSSSQPLEACSEPSLPSQPALPSDSSTYKPTAKAVLDKAILTHAPTLRVGFADPKRLLTAIAVVESGYGTYNVPKYEKAYDLGGRYGNKAEWLKWGALAACSYSSFQIMYAVAREMGYQGSPIGLCHDDVALPYVIKLLQRRILDRGASTLADVADAYNSGNFRDSVVPTAYIAKFLAAYNESK